TPHLERDSGELRLIRTKRQQEYFSMGGLTAPKHRFLCAGLLFLARRRIQSADSPRLWTNSFSGLS
ncbi:hypothetical protein, partial [Bradyrhizobium sp.]|uniref:hypothetical protein n=1 Tax=Bradyrhizobium sp. TaxID=376 RepID=UPI003C1C1622